MHMSFAKNGATVVCIKALKRVCSSNMFLVNDELNESYLLCVTKA